MWYICICFKFYTQWLIIKLYLVSYSIQVFLLFTNLNLSLLIYWHCQCRISIKHWWSQRLVDQFNINHEAVFPLRAKGNIAMLVTTNAMRLWVLKLSLHLSFQKFFILNRYARLYHSLLPYRATYRLSPGVFFYIIASPCLCDASQSSFLQYYYLETFILLCIGFPHYICALSSKVKLPRNHK